MSQENGYLNLLQELVNESETGQLVQDRTGVGTYNLFHRSLRFDLSKEFPLLTTKKMSIKSILGELLWFISGSTNALELEEKYGCTIWREWKGEFGDLGCIYSHLWRYLPVSDTNSVVLVKKKTFTDNYEQPVNDFEPCIDVDLNTEDMWAISVVETSPNTRYKFQTKTGFIGEISRPNWKMLRSVDTVDGYKRTVAGVGYHGSYCGDSIINDQLYSMWRNMIIRCYDKTHPAYKFYGAKGIKVAKFWHSYENFKKSIASVPFFHLWKKFGGDYHLDKDYFGSEVYSPETCIFLHKSINGSCESDTAISIKGVIYKSWAHFEKLTSIRSDYMKKRLELVGKYKEFLSSDVEILTPPDGYVFRRKVFVDQLESLVEEIKTNPTSRRLYVSSAMKSEREFQALDCCHNYFQVVIKSGKLNLYFQMRSTDVFLGLPYNIASYALLAHMLALETGYEVGELVYSGVDVHLYSNHIEQAKEQLKREPKGFPTLIVNKKPFFDYNLDDFKVIGYESHPTIKADVAI